MNYKPVLSPAPSHSLPQSSQTLSNLKSCRCGDTGKCNEKVYLKCSANLFPSISEIPSHIKVPGRVGRGGGGLFQAVHPYSWYCSSFSPFPLFLVLFLQLFLEETLVLISHVNILKEIQDGKKSNKEQANKMAKSYPVTYSELCSQDRQLLAVCLVLHILKGNREEGSIHFLCIL